MIKKIIEGGDMMRVISTELKEAGMVSSTTSQSPINGEKYDKQCVVNSPQEFKTEMTDEKGQPTKQAYQTAVNKMNQFMEYQNKNSKFVFHEGLEKYYVEIVDAKTDKVIKEIPPKEILDAYYEMQKMIGKIVDKTV